MDILSTSSSLDVKSIFYCGDTCEIVYVFEVDGVDISFEGKLRKNGDIKGIEYGDKLESFLMDFMPVDRAVSKKLSLLTWRYVEGESIEFPVSLISSSANVTILPK
ncbi:hypothetical protein [Pseudomonas pergaminensis]|jgi:hypothetical protein